MAQHTICPRCAKRLPPSARFCRRCGMTQKVSPSFAAASSSAAFDATPYSPAPASTPYTPPPQYAPTRGRPKRPATRGPAPVRTGAGGGARGGWIVALLVIFVVRACITSTNQWHAEPHPLPPVRQYHWTPPPLPPSEWTPPAELDNQLKRFHERHTDPFDRRYFPDDPATTPEPPTPALPPETPAPPDRPTE